METAPPPPSLVACPAHSGAGAPPLAAATLPAPRQEPLKQADPAALQSCQQLRALRCSARWVRGQPAALQAIAALPQLQHLCVVGGSGDDPPMDGATLAALAACSQLKQLTLRGVKQLPESTLAALMAGLTRLRLLRLLSCSPELSQERCQALVGRLGLWALQVDAVVDDGSARASWMIVKLAKRWREAA